MEVSDRTVNNYLKRGMPRDTIAAAIAWREQSISKTPGLILILIRLTSRRHFFRPNFAIKQNQPDAQDQE